MSVVFQFEIGVPRLFVDLSKRLAVAWKSRTLIANRIVQICPSG